MCKNNTCDEDFSLYLMVPKAPACPAPLRWSFLSEDGETFTHFYKLQHTVYVASSLYLSQQILEQRSFRASCSKGLKVDQTVIVLLHRDNIIIIIIIIILIIGCA